MRNAIGGMHALLRPREHDRTLLTVDGHVHDGWSSGGISLQEWTYNAGVALGALSSLYLATNDSNFLMLAESVAKTSSTLFWQSGHLAEIDLSSLNLDQYSFKVLSISFSIVSCFFVLLIFNKKLIREFCYTFSMTFFECISKRIASYCRQHRHRQRNDLSCPNGYINCTQS